ncbi:MAG: arginine decarboxylase, pyruvoyl-dependent [Deltaproteobacteria bacterium]|nr:arginine decarboxylase, pyruvoyl-dependent [Deltaproteobacteria bacterium]
MYVPSKIFLTKGVGSHQDKLTSFEMALRDARIASFNLVKVSSIYPPGCNLISANQALRLLQPGLIVHCVMIENSTNEPNRLISASIGLAIPADKKKYGYISEYHSFGETDKETGDYAGDIAASMLATVLGIDFDINQSYDEKKEIWRMSGKIVKTTNIAQSAVGGKDRKWTTVVAAAVLIE